jgi:hypothetical protein
MSCQSRTLIATEDGSGGTAAVEGKCAAHAELRYEARQRYSDTMRPAAVPVQLADSWPASLYAGSEGYGPAPILPRTATTAHKPGKPTAYGPIIRLRRSKTAHNRAKRGH